MPPEVGLLNLTKVNTLENIAWPLLGFASTTFVAICYNPVEDPST